MNLPNVNSYMHTSLQYPVFAVLISLNETNGIQKHAFRGINCEFYWSTTLTSLKALQIQRSYFFI
jgi:hypothetical protein